MHIIFPVVVGSNAMEVLSGDLFGGYTHLMEFRSNERLRRAFPHHPVGTALLGRDIRSEFLPGARLDVHSHGTTIVCLGVSPQMGEAIVQGLVSRLCEETPIDEIVVLSMFREVPGAGALWDAFVSAGVAEIEWNSFSAMMRGEKVSEPASEPVEPMEDPKGTAIETPSAEVCAEPVEQVEETSLPTGLIAAATSSESPADAISTEPESDPAENVESTEIKENNE